MYLFLSTLSLRNKLNNKDRVYVLISWNLSQNAKRMHEVQIKTIVGAEYYKIPLYVGHTKL